MSFKPGRRREEQGGFKPFYGAPPQPITRFIAPTPWQPPPFSYPTAVMQPSPRRVFRKNTVAVIGPLAEIPLATSVTTVSPSKPNWWNHVPRDVEFTLINAQPKDLGVESEVLIRTLPGRVVWRLIDMVKSSFEVTLLNYAERIISPSYEKELRHAGVRVPITIGMVESDFCLDPPRTIFVWCQMNARCGIAEYVNHLRSARPNSITLPTAADALQFVRDTPGVKEVVVVLMPGMAEDPATLAGTFREIKACGVKTLLNVHHYSHSHAVHLAAKEADDTILHHPDAPGVAGWGRYVPLLVPRIPDNVGSKNGPYLGGLVHFGIAHQVKRFDVMNRIASAVGERLYCYGKDSHLAPAWCPGLKWDHVEFNEFYGSDRQIADFLQQHSVALIGRQPILPLPQLWSSASARFLIAAGIPAVIDDRAPHDDLKRVLDVVSYDDQAAVVDRVKLLLTDQSFRFDALAKMREYAEANSPEKTIERMFG